jgi:superfamily II DNA or RNA helicase
MLKEKKNSLLVVPSINLVDQMFSDFVDYGMENAEDFIKQIGGDHKSSKDLSEKPIVISTWQSLQMMSKKEFEIFEVILVDECHTAKSDVLNSIINKSINSSWKIGMTGTVPRTRVDKLMLFGALGRQYTVITPGGLIKRGLATPITINALYLNYSKGDRELFNRGKPNYQDEVKFVEKHYFRNKKIGEMLIKIATKGNVLSLFTHIEHGESLLKYCIEERTGYSNIELLHKITPKPIKEAYEKWEKDKDLIFYMNSPINKKDRDKIIKNASKVSPEHAVEFSNSIKSLDDINIFFVSGKVSGADREYIRKNLETININEIILEFEDFSIKVNKDEKVLLENGEYILADKIDENTDISNKWIEEKKNEQFEQN